MITLLHSFSASWLLPPLSPVGAAAPGDADLAGADAPGADEPGAHADGVDAGSVRLRLTPSSSSTTA